MAVHVAYMQQVSVDANGNRIDKAAGSTTLRDVANANIEWRVMPDVTIPSSANYPTLGAYLAAEEALGFRLQFMSQTVIVTYDAP